MEKINLYSKRIGLSEEQINYAERINAIVQVSTFLSKVMIHHPESLNNDHVTVQAHKIVSKFMNDEEMASIEDNHFTMFSGQDCIFITADASNIGAAMSFARKIISKFDLDESLEFDVSSEDPDKLDRMRSAILDWSRR